VKANGRKALFFIPIAACTGVAMLALSPAAPAQKAPSSSSDQTNSYTLSQDTYDQVTRAQKLMGDGNYQQARSVAQSLLARASKESKYAEALVDEIIAQTYLLQKNYDAAEPYLEKIV
jgi:hypothetical protein